MNQTTERRKEMALLTQQGYSLTKIAEKYSISKQRVHQILQKAKKEGFDVKINRRVKENKLLNCIVCTKEFNVIGYKKIKTCSKECLEKLQKRGGKWSRYEFITLICANCKKLFTRSNYRESITERMSGQGNRFCSRECYISSEIFKNMNKKLS